MSVAPAPSDSTHAPGRVGPSVCVLTSVSPPNGSHKLQQWTVASESLGDFPTFAPAEVGATAGKHYHELQIKSTGCVQAGYAIKGKFNATGRGNGVGDDKQSWAIDGSKGKIYRAKKDLNDASYKWSKDDVVGFALDADAATLAISINGKEVATINLAEESDYKPGDVLTPAVSLSGRESCVWRFTAEALQFLPAGFQPLQTVATPRELLVDPKAAPSSEAGDALDVPDALERLLASYAPVVSTPGTDKSIKHFTELRGGVWEYGLDWHIPRIVDPLEKVLPKAFEGALPNLKMASSFARDGKEQMDKLRLAHRQLTHWTAMFLAIYGREEAAKETVDKLRAVESKFVSVMPDALAKFRYVEACEDRKNGCGIDYGINWTTERFVTAMNKDRSRMSASDVEKHVAELTKEKEKIVKWRAWFVARVGDLPMHTAKLEEVDGYLRQFDNLFDPKAMEADQVAKLMTQAEKDLDELVRRGRSSIADAVKEFERFPERAADKYRALQKQIDDLKAAHTKAQSEKQGEALSAAQVAALKVAALVGSDRFGAWESEVRVATENWQRAEDLRLLTRDAAEHTRAVLSLLSDGANMVSHHRVDEAQEKLYAAVAKVAELKTRPGFLGLPIVLEFFAGYETKREDLENKIRAWRLDRETSTAARELRSAVGDVEQLFGHYRNEEALAKHFTALERLQSLQSRTEWSEIECVKTAVAEADQRLKKFVEEYKERVSKKQADEAIRACNSALQLAKSDLSHHRHEACLEQLHKSKELTEQLRSDALLSTLPVSAEWMATFAVEYPAVHKEYERVMLQRAVDDAVRVARGAFQETQDHLSHSRFEHCLTSLSRYRDLCGAMERDPRFRGHAQIEEFLRESDERVPELERKYRDTMVQREYNEAVRVANGHWSQANSLFEHSRFEEALAELHQFREAVDAIQKREEYSSGAMAVERDEFVKTALETKIPEWQEKYKTKVLGRRADDLARELRTALNSARDHLSHYRDEQFLDALQVLREKARDAEPKETDSDASDARLMSQLPQTKEALEEAFTALHDLSQQYDTRVLDKRFAESQRTLDTALHQANDLLGRSNFDGALTQFAAARDAAAEIEAAGFPAQRTEELMQSFRTKAADFQSRFDTTTQARRSADVARDVESKFGSAKNLFSHYRHEEALTELHAARDALQSFVDEFKGSAEADSKASKWSADMDAFEKEYKERVLTREATEAVQRARAELSFAESHFEHSRFEKALESLSLARAAAGAVSVDTRFQGLAIVDEFEKEFEPRVSAFTVRFEEKQVEREAAERIRSLVSALGEMESHFSHHRLEAALEAYTAAAERRRALEAGEGERFASRAEVRTADAEADQRLKKFKADYQTRVLGDKLRSSTSAALTKLGEAENALEHSRFEESLERLHAARELAGAVGGDPMLLGMAEVDEFLRTFTERAEALRAKHSATTRARAQADAKRVAASEMNDAKSHFEHHRDEDSLAALHRARQAVAAFDAEFGRDAEGAAFVSSATTEQAAFEQAYAARVFQQEIDRKVSKARSRLTASNDALSHHRHEEAMRTLLEADEAAALLAGDERFLKLEQVDRFLAEHAAASKDTRTKIDAALREKASRELTRVARSLVDEAVNLYAHHRYDEALAAAHKARTCVEEEVAADASLAPLAAELQSRLQEFRTRFQKERLSSEADALIRGTNALLDNAEFLLGHHRHEDALGALQRARESAAQLGDDTRFEGVDSVAAFFATWPARVVAVQTAINEKLLSKRAREAVDEARRPLNEAEAYLNKHVHDLALERLHQAVDKAQVIRDDKELVQLATAKEFLAQFDTQRTALAQRITREVYGREVDAALRTTRTHLAQARALFDRYAYEGALGAFSEARESVRVTNDDERVAKAEEWVAFVKGEWTEQSGEFVRNYGEKVSGEEARTIAASVRPHLAKAGVFLERGVREKAEEALNEARTAAEPMLDSAGMLVALDVTKALVAELRALQLAFAQKFLEQEANAAVESSKKHLQRAARAESRALDVGDAYQAAREAVLTLLGESLETPVAEPYAQLASVCSFVKDELVPALTRAGVDVFVVSAPGGPGGASGKGGDESSADAILGPRFPHLAILRKGLPNIPLSTEVHPKFFSCLKATNQAAVIAAKAVRELTSTVNSMSLSAFQGEPSIFSIQAAEYPIDGVERALVDFGKALASLASDLSKDPAAQEDAVYKTLHSGYAAFSTAFRQSLEVLRRFESLVSKARSMVNAVNDLKHLHDKQLSVAVHTQCPVRIDRTQYVPGMEPSNLGFPEMQDAHIGLLIVATAKRCVARIQQWADGEFGGKFVERERLIDALNGWAMLAKRMHVDHCIRQIQRSFRDPAVRAEYMAQLVSFPLARAEALKRAAAYVAFTSECRSETLEMDLVDPGQKGDVDPDEKPEWYIEEWEYVVPGDKANGLAFNKWADQSTDAAVYTPARKAAEGKIVFSRSNIDASGESSQLGAKFDLAEVTSGEGIFARAYWPRALRNYALAKRRDNGAPVYGPETINDHVHRLEVMLFVKIDGKTVERDNRPHGAFARFVEGGRGAAQEKGKYHTGAAADFWAWQQSCTLAVLASDLHTERKMADEWTGMGARFAYEFSKLAPGEHAVELELKWRLRPSEDNWLAHPKAERSPRKFPYTTTPLSATLAAGAFTLVVPQNKVARRSVLPISNPSLADSPAARAATEEALRQWLQASRSWGARETKQERPIHAALQTGFFDSSFQWFGAVVRGEAVLVKESVCRSRDFYAAFRRHVADGWARDQVAVFDLAANGVEQRNPQSQLPPVGSVSVGTNWTFDLQLLSEADQALP